MQTVTLSRPFQGLRRHAARLNFRAEKLWRAYPREIVGIGVLSFAGAAAIGGAAQSTPELTNGQAILENVRRYRAIAALKTLLPRRPC